MSRIALRDLASKGQNKTQLNRRDVEFMKFGLSSSGCESRPTKAEPGRSVVSLAVVPVMARLMRRQASKWAAGMQPRNGSSREAQGVTNPEGSRDVTASGRGGVSRGGVDDRGTFEEDGPVTWETPVCPRTRTGVAEAPYPKPPTRLASADARRAGSEEASAPR